MAWVLHSTSSFKENNCTWYIYVKGNLNQKFIDDRMTYLHEFCNKITSSKYLWYSNEFQIFLRSNTSDIEKVFIPDIWKSFASIPKITNYEIIDKYQNAFADLAGKEINS